MKCRNEAPLHIEEWRIHAKPKFKGGTPQKSNYSAVAWLFSWIPNYIIARKISMFFLELIGTGLNFLQAQNVGLLAPCPPQCIFAKCGTQAVYVPGDDLHHDYFMVNFTKATP